MVLLANIHLISSRKTEFWKRINSNNIRFSHLMPDEDKQTDWNGLSSGKFVPARDGGEAFLELLTASNIDFIFFNPGSDYYPILEHLSEFEEQGRVSPKQIFCLSEHLALSMAHGHAMLTNRAQVVMVHVGLGTLQLGGALHNVYRGRAPVLIVAGRAPYSFEGESLGGRDRPYHWDQELFDQLGLVREFAKWTYELKTNANLHHVVNRALQMANAEPQGPVYLVLPRELLAEKQSTVRVLPKERWEPPAPSQANCESLEKIAEVMIGAENPVILTEYLGRNQDAVKSLVLLSELLGCAVMEPTRKRMNFPTDHHHYMNGFQKDIVESADVILLLDVDVPWAPAIHRIRQDAKVLQIDLDPLKARIPLWGFPIDVSVLASTENALPELLKIIQRKTESRTDLSNRRRERSSKLSERHEKIRENLRLAANKYSKLEPIKVEFLFSTLNMVKNADAVVMSEGVTNEPIIESYLDSVKPGTYFGSGGSNLGDGLGNALGLKLAAPHSDVICIIGDGGFVYSNPTAVFWTAAKYSIATVNVIINNGGYRAMKGAVERGYPEGWSKKKNVYSGARIDPVPNYVAAANACGAAGWKVDEPNQIENVLSMALNESRRGRPCVVDVLVERV